MEITYLDVQEVYVYSSYQDEVFIGCRVQGVNSDDESHITLRIPAHIYLSDFAGKLKQRALDNYKAHLDTL
jgi:hypothetical protein